MSKKFKVGDKVRCIDEGTGRCVQDGAVYEISYVEGSPRLSGSSGMVKVKGVYGDFWDWRFEKVEEAASPAPFKTGDKVLCINADYVMDIGLRQGETYEVKDWNDYRLHLKGIKDFALLDDRFVLLEKN